MDKIDAESKCQISESFFVITVDWKKQPSMQLPYG